MHGGGRRQEMKSSIIRRILAWLTPPEQLDNEIKQTKDDIAFLTDKIHLAKRMYSDVIAKKLTVQRDKLIKKRTRLRMKQKHLFNK